MLTYKTSEDFKKMAKAGKVVSNIHYEIYNSTKPGMTLKDLDGIAKNIVENSNVQSSFLVMHPLDTILILLTFVPHQMTQ